MQQTTTLQNISYSTLQKQLNSNKLQHTLYYTLQHTYATNYFIATYTAQHYYRAAHG